MKLKVLDRYLLREFFPPLFAGLGLFLFILLMDRLFDLADLMLNRGVPPLVVLRLMGCFLPSVIAVALPMAMLLAAVLAFGRLAQDRELTALKGVGVGLVRLAVPLAAGGLAASLLLLVFNGTVMPKATTAYKRILLTIVRQRATVAFRERVFIREFDRYLVYFQRREGREGVLRDVTVIESPPSPPRVITADRGRLRVDAEGYRMTLELEHGMMDQPADMTGEHYSRIEFDSYIVELDIHNALRGGDFFAKGLDEMTYADLLRRMKELRAVPVVRREYEVALHQRIALAFAPFFVVLIGVPLGSLARRGGGVGIMLSLGVIFVYYSLLTVGRGIADRGHLPPALALWLPNVFLAVAAAAAFWAAVREARWLRWVR